jgi:hypothetical protein
MTTAHVAATTRKRPSGWLGSTEASPPYTVEPTPEWCFTTGWVVAGVLPEDHFSRPWSMSYDVSRLIGIAPTKEDAEEWAVELAVEWALS